MRLRTCLALAIAYVVVVLAIVTASSLAYFSGAVGNPQTITTDRPADWVHLVAGASYSGASGQDDSLTVDLNGSGGGACRAGAAAFAVAAVPTFPAGGLHAVGLSVSGGPLTASFEGAGAAVTNLAAGASDAVNLAQTAPVTTATSAAVEVTLAFTDGSQLHYDVPVKLCHT